MSKGKVYWKHGKTEDILDFIQLGNGNVKFSTNYDIYVYQPEDPTGNKFYRLIDSDTGDHIPVVAIDRIEIDDVNEHAKDPIIDAVVEIEIMLSKAKINWTCMYDPKERSYHIKIDRGDQNDED